MEFKISKKSEANLKKMLKEEEEARQRLVREMEDRKREYKEKYGFKSANEFIEWILSGKKAVSELDSRENITLVGDWVQFITEDYSDCDIPLGYSAKYKTIEEFKNWVYKIENQIPYKQDFYMECLWEKEFNEMGE